MKDNSASVLYLSLYLLFALLTISKAHAEEKLMYNNSNIKSAIGIYDPNSGKVYFALYRNKLSPVDIKQVEKSGNLKTGSYKVVGYIHLDLPLGTKKFNTSDVVNYTLEFLKEDSWEEAWKDAEMSAIPANFNFKARGKNGAPDLSLIKRASGGTKLGDRVSLVISGERTFSRGTPTFSVDLNLKTDILLVWDHP